MTSAKTVTLISSDGEEFEIPINVASQSKLIKSMIDDIDASEKVPLSVVNSVTLAKVIEYCQKHADHEATVEDGGANNRDEELEKWDVEFLKGKKYQSLFQIILAANYLDIKNLLDVSCQVVADKVKDKSVKEAREIFYIKNDHPPEEEEKIRRENAWAFEI